MIPLKPLHSSLIASKLDAFKLASTEDLQKSLIPGQPHSLKVRPDGTMLDGNHRIHILSTQGIDVDALPREVLPRDTSDFFDDSTPT